MARLSWRRTAAEFYARWAAENDDDLLLCPEWLEGTDDALESLYAVQDLIFLEGCCVPGCVVQASSSLYRRKGGDGIAYVVYSFDPFFLTQPIRLRILAQRVAEIDEKTAADEEERFLAQVLDTPEERVFALPLPKRLTGGKEAFLTMTVIHRETLPGGGMCGSLYPFAVRRGEIPDALLIPARYWVPCSCPGK